jgi:hypothetical protein
VSERPHRVRTWAPKGETPALQYSFTWNQLSAVAGVTFRKFYFKLVKGAVRASDLVTFLKDLRHHLAPARCLSSGIGGKLIAAVWCATMSKTKAAA